MSELYIQRIVISVCFLVLNYGVFAFFNRSARHTYENKGIRKTRYILIRKLIRLVGFGSAMVGLILIWGLSFKNVWLSVSSAVAVVAIAFFALWSLVGNILAGIIIYFTSPFRIEDEIEIMPDEIKGEVLAINTFYTVLRDEELNFVNVPNSIFFQKYIRVRNKATVRPEPVPEDEAAEKA